MFAAHVPPLGDKLDLLLAESLRVAHDSGALRTRDLARITVDTTVQPKNITFPTDAKLLHAAIKGRAGDAANAILTAAGYNFRRILAWLRMFLRLILYPVITGLNRQSALNPAY